MQEVFRGVFRPSYVDLFGGLDLFTEAYIVRTLAQDVATAECLAALVGGTPVTCVERHLGLLRHGWHGEVRSEPLDLCSADGAALHRLRNHPEVARLRSLLRAYLADGDGSPKSLADAATAVAATHPDWRRERAWLHRCGERRCLKIPFESSWSAPRPARQGA